MFDFKKCYFSKKKRPGQVKFLFLFLFLLTSCYKNHLYVQIENVDKNQLASSYIKSPDYRQKRNFYGQRVIIGWYFPKELFKKGLFVYLTVRFWDNKEVIKVFKVKKMHGIGSFYFPNKDRSKKNKILTYKVEVFTKEKELVDVWKHQFWTELIDVDKRDDLQK